ncbi:PilZ domain-containing protein [bacterium]|nr:MAG: PilZ domain-containing protein [bacterium]
MDERRKFRRTGAKEKAQIRAAQSRHEGALLDISSGGMRILSENHIAIGTQLSGQFKIMPRTGNFYVSGEVVWVKPAKEPQANGYEIGIKFAKVSASPLSR